MENNKRFMRRTAKEQREGAKNGNSKTKAVYSVLPNYVGQAVAKRSCFSSLFFVPLLFTVRGKVR